MRRYGKVYSLWLLACLMLSVFAVAQAQSKPTENQIALDTGWKIQSSAQVKAKGNTISTDSFNPQGWYSTSLPSTVLSALVAHNVYPDPYSSMNLRAIPGTNYPIGHNFSNLPMPADSPFGVSWWYRKAFKLPPTARHKTVWLNFDTINYRANVWVNGHLVASADQVAGMYRTFEFDITAFALPDANNTLAVEIFPPGPTDLSITYVDWNPMPPDKEMGLVGDVYLLTSGPVALRQPQVTTKLDTASDTAMLTVAGDVQNTTDRSLTGTLKARIGDVVVSQTVPIAAHETLRIEFAPDSYPQLRFTHPRLWWPYPVGPQNLYHLQLQLTINAAVSDQQDLSFGIREITSELDSQQHRLFKINGKPILIRGGGWTSDMLMRFSPEREENELRFVRDMHLNTVRLEGKMMNDHFFETCDRYGILVMAGWCCCSYWEEWKDWQPADYVVAGASLRDQLRRLRNHPCLLAWLYGSDNSPDAQAEALYLKILREERWPNPFISSASEQTTVGAGPTGVKMTGPYDYVAPNYWLLDKGHGGAFGFNTETSPGPAVPEMASLRKMLPADHLWPIDDFWNFHAGGGAFSTLDLFTLALENRYGKATGLDDYVRKSQLMTYEGERAMFEAFGKNKYGATGVIQWMLNNAWPSVIWHLYDYYLQPGGGYFGAKKACEPLHVQYSYDDRSIVVVNSYYHAFPGVRVSAKVYSSDLAEKFSQANTLDISPDSSTQVFTIPDIAGLSTVYFVKLTLQDGEGKQVSSNFYWLSTQQDVSDWGGSNWRYTPIKSYADFTGLASLPAAQVKMSTRTVSQGTERIAHVTVENPTPRLAFCVHLRLLREKRGDEIAPVRWEDNYFALMPGEKREITATYAQKLLGKERATVAVDGWNLAPAVRASIH